MEASHLRSARLYQHCTWTHVARWQNQSPRFCHYFLSYVIRDRQLRTRPIASPQSSLFSLFSLTSLDLQFCKFEHHHTHHVGLVHIYNKSQFYFNSLSLPAPPTLDFFSIFFKDLSLFPIIFHFSL